MENDYVQYRRSDDVLGPGKRPGEDRKFPERDFYFCFSLRFRNESKKRCRSGLRFPGLKRFLTTFLAFEETMFPGGLSPLATSYHACLRARCGQWLS